MADKLVIVESPAKAKTISKFLGHGYTVEASNGHVRDLPKSQTGVDIEHNYEPKYITIRGHGEIVEKLKKKAKSAKAIYLATDPDREGEAISWHLAHLLKMDDKAPCRIEFHEITKQAVKSAIKNPRQININLVDAQQARRVVDRLVGYSISPLLWEKVRKRLSAGRVQSVATRMICDREAEINAFQPKEYWTVIAKLHQEGKKAFFHARLVTYKGKRIDEITAEIAAEAKERLQQAEFSVDGVRKGEKRKNPPAPFTTSTLQQEAARKLSFTTKRTMMVAQQLYEGVDVKGQGTIGLVTYIRTDSTRISTEAQEAAKEYLMDKYGAEYVPETFNQFKGRRGAQDAHEAIRPTVMSNHPDLVKESLTSEQYKLYKLIYTRFLASQMTPTRFETMTATIGAGDYGFRFSGAKMSFPGFSAVYAVEADEADAQDESKLFNLHQGEKLQLEELDAAQHFTEPPARYSEASLVRALEEKGIGRPSTYAPIISTILERGYVRRENKMLAPTELGNIINDIMMRYFSSVVDIAFTAQMEDNLDHVEEGDMSWQSVVDEFYQPFSKSLAHAQEAMEKIEVKDEVSDVTCEKCGAKMVYKIGRFGKFLACPNYPQCKNTRPIVQELEVPCPKCGSKLVVRRSKRGRTFYGCEKYPECDFVSWNMPVKEKCPECGGYMVLRKRNGVNIHQCANEECGYSHNADVPQPS